MMKMIITMHLPYMICMYVHVHEKRNELEYKVHQYHGMKMKVKIFKRHRTFLYLCIPTCIQFSRLLPTEKNRTRSFIHSFTQF